MYLHFTFRPCPHILTTITVPVFDAREWISGKFQHVFAESFSLASIDGLCYKVFEDPPPSSVVAVIHSTTHFGEPASVALNVIAVIVLVTPAGIKWPATPTPTKYPFALKDLSTDLLASPPPLLQRRLQ
jgi:hypothetical protein